MELGAGTALPSLLVAAYGHTAIATDLKKVLPLTQQCLSLNPNLSGSLKAMELYWGNNDHLDQVIAQCNNKIDYIICADLIYLEETFEDLIATLKRLSVEGRRPMILMSYKIRLPELTQKFIDMFKAEFEVIEELNISDIHPHANEKFIKAKLKE